MAHSRLRSAAVPPRDLARRVPLMSRGTGCQLATPFTRSASTSRRTVCQLALLPPLRPAHRQRIE